MTEDGYLLTTSYERERERETARSFWLLLASHKLMHHPLHIILVFHTLNGLSLLYKARSPQLAFLLWINSSSSPIMGKNQKNISIKQQRTSDDSKGTCIKKTKRTRRAAQRESPPQRSSVYRGVTRSALFFIQSWSDIVSSL